MVEQMNCRVSELNNQNINVYKSKQNLSKFVVKLLIYRIMFEDILTFLGLDNRYASFITLNFVVLGISIPKDLMNRIIISHKNLLTKI